MIKLTRYIITNREQTKFSDGFSPNDNIEEAFLWRLYENVLSCFNSLNKYQKERLNSIAEVEITYNVKNIRFLE